MLSKIFKAYDVRGVYGSDLTEDIAYRIGRAFVCFLDCKEVVVGYDMRLSSPALSKAFMSGVVDSGADCIDIGQVSTDGLYFASGFIVKPGVMFTASHNPKEFNGIKFCKSSAVPINEVSGLREIKNLVEKGSDDVKKEKGKIIQKNILGDYVKHVHSFSDCNVSKLKIAVDAGNGMAGKIIPLIYDSLDVEIVPLYFELDGNFPNHPADPSKYENLKDLQKKVIGQGCDFGMAFDGDADRVFFVDEMGEVVNSSLISCLIIKNLLSKHKGSSIIYNLVCSRIVPDTISKYGGKAIIERVGHSFIKETMKETKSLFACEHSAHYYFSRNFNADSGMIASIIVSGIISKERKKLSELLSEFKFYHKIEEMNFKVNDKLGKLKELKEYFSSMNPIKVMELDGLSVEFSDYWFNVRASNTESLLRLNLEAKSKEVMKEKSEEISKLMG